jgi:uncharacterized protein YktA (UPF0223 family)
MDKKKMDSENINFIQFMWEQEENYRKSLSNNELIEYLKYNAIMKLKPFLKKWIFLHFGKTYLDNKYSAIKKYKEDLDFYYAITDTTYF